VIIRGLLDYWITGMAHSRLRHASGKLDTQIFRIDEKTSLPTPSMEGRAIIFMSDGTNYGEDGDIISRHTANSETYTTLVAPKTPSYYSEYISNTDIRYSSTTWVNITGTEITLPPGNYLMGISLSLSCSTPSQSIWTAIREKSSGTVLSLSEGINFDANSRLTTGATFLYAVNSETTYVASFRANGGLSSVAVDGSIGTGQTNPDCAQTLWAIPVGRIVGDF
jgi:hypothetical protein